MPIDNGGIIFGPIHSDIKDGSGIFTAQAIAQLSFLDAAAIMSASCIYNALPASALGDNDEIAVKAYEIADALVREKRRREALP